MTNHEDHHIVRGGVSVGRYWYDRPAFDNPVTGEKSGYCVTRICLLGGDVSECVEIGESLWRRNWDDIIASPNSLRFLERQLRALEKKHGRPPESNGGAFYDEIMARLNAAIQEGIKE